MSLLDQKLNRPDLGLLVLRVVFGGVLFISGLQKLLAGREMLEGVGKAMGMFGITFEPVFWGLLAALTETFGGLFLVLGFMFRWAALLTFFTLVVATASMWPGPPDFSSVGKLGEWLSHILTPLAFATVFLALLLTGPGRFAIKGSGSRSPVRHGD